MSHNPALILNLAIAAAAIIGLVMGHPLALLALFFLRDIPILAGDFSEEQLQAVAGDQAQEDEGEPWATDHRMGFHAKIK